MIKTSKRTHFDATRYEEVTNILWNPPTVVREQHLRGSVTKTYTRPEPVYNEPDSTGYRMPSNYYGRTTYSGWAGNKPVVPVVGGYPLQRISPTVTTWMEAELPLVLPNIEVPTADINEVRMKVRNNVRDEIFDVAMVLAEMNETVGTIASAFSRIGRSMAAVRSKDKRVFEYLWNGQLPRDRNGHVIRGRSVDRFNRQAAGMYLEWKYGVMPSVYDAAGAIATLDAIEEGSLWNHPPILTARATSKRSSTATIKCEVSEPGGWKAKDVMARIKYESDVKARLDYSVSSEGLHGLNRFGIGLTTLPTILWDRTPFTFVFDMVVPVSDLIKAWGALANVDVKSYCETTYTRAEVQGMPIVGLSDYGREHAYTLKTTEILKDFDRVTFGTRVPLPMPFVRNPIKTGNLSSVLALFTQMRPK